MLTHCLLPVHSKSSHYLFFGDNCIPSLFLSPFCRCLSMVVSAISSFTHQQTLPILTIQKNMTKRKFSSCCLHSAQRERQKNEEVKKLHSIPSFIPWVQSHSHPSSSSSEPTLSHGPICLQIPVDSFVSLQIQNPWEHSTVDPNLSTLSNSHPFHPVWDWIPGTVQFGRHSMHIGFYGQIFPPTQTTDPLYFVANFYQFLCPADGQKYFHLCHRP